MALKCAYAINHKLLRLHLDVMKRSNNDELMMELLQEIEQFSVRNLEAHKRADQLPAPESERSEEESDGGSRTSQEQADYELALKLQQEERDKCNNSSSHVTNNVAKPEERRTLPIISPPMAPPPDPTKTFGFFSGHYMKLKQRWDESVGVYLNKGDVSLAASPGHNEIYNSHSGDEEEDQFVDAVEVQSARSSSLSSIESPTSPSSLTFGSPPDSSPVEDSGPPPLGSPLPGDISFFDSPLSDMTESAPSDLLNSPQNNDCLSNHDAFSQSFLGINNVAHHDSSSDGISNSSTDVAVSEYTNSTNSTSENTGEYTISTTDSRDEYTNSTNDYTEEYTPTSTDCSSDITAGSQVSEVPPVYYSGH